MDAGLGRPEGCTSGPGATGTSRGNRRLWMDAGPWRPEGCTIGPGDRALAGGMQIRGDSGCGCGGSRQRERQQVGGQNTEALLDADHYGFSSALTTLVSLVVPLASERADSISARWEYACGKFPSSRWVPNSISSLKSPRWLL
jgi:hypothetical protein